VLARKLGWSPRREGEWTETFRIELEEYQKNPPVESAFVKLIKKMTSGASSAFNTASSQ
jgi:arsenate reductase-like glutaredoxin family protein